MGVRLLPLLFIVFVGCSLLPGERPGPLPAVPLSLGFQSDRLGIVFVNGVGIDASEQRYQQAVAAGAGWTRWPIYWYAVESERGRLDDAAYAAVDQVVAQDRAHGLRINAVLLGTPHWAGTAGSRDAPFTRVEQKGLLPPRGGLTPLGVAVETSPPANLGAPVFLPSGAINPDNPWGYFVFNTVSRYRGRVAAWELWNEPDLTDEDGRGIFWGGSAEDYYRLLKVGYLAAKAADPNAQVLFGGLAFWTDQGFLPRILDLMAADPTAPQKAHYFDVLPLHLYSNPEHLYRITLLIRDEMARRGIAKPIWVNETNLPVCGDAAVDPGFSCPRLWRGSLEEQAAFVIQAYALAAAAGVERTFAFQHYDGVVGEHDWYGLVRNDGSHRPAYVSYQAAAAYLSQAASVERRSDGGIETVVFHGTPRGRVSVLWNSTGASLLAHLPAVGERAKLVDKYGTERVIVASGGQYTLVLPPASNRDDVNGGYLLGGDPFLIVEEVSAVPYLMTGRVADRRGQGLAGARVEALAMPFSTTTDASGAYTLTLPSGTYQVKASMRGYGPLPPKAIAAAPSLVYDFFLPWAEDWMQNGGFEEGWRGWSASGGAYLKTFRHTGEWGAYITPTATLRQRVATETGPSYLSFMYRAPRTAAPGELVVTVDDGRRQSHVVPLVPDDTWRLGGLFVEATGSEMVLGFVVRGRDDTVVWLDEVSWSRLPGYEYRLNLPAVFRSP